MTRDLLAMALARKNRDLAARLLAPVFAATTENTRSSRWRRSAISWTIWCSITPRHQSWRRASTICWRRILHKPSRYLCAAAQPPDRRTACRIARRGGSLPGRDEPHADDDRKLLASLLNPPAPWPFRRPPSVRWRVSIGTRSPVFFCMAGRAAAPVRTAILDAMIGREPWAYELLNRVEARELSGADIDPHPPPAPGPPRFSALPSWPTNCRRNLRLSRTKVLENYRGVIELTGDAARGEKVFAANCVTCHHLGNLGQEIGPESPVGRGVARRCVDGRDPRSQPHRRAAYLGLQLRARHGRDGLRPGDQRIRRRRHHEGNRRQARRTIPRRQIKSLECTNRSLMPDGLEAAIDSSNGRPDQVSPDPGTAGREIGWSEYVRVGVLAHHPADSKVQRMVGEYTHPTLCVEMFPSDPPCTIAHQGPRLRR